MVGDSDLFFILVSEQWSFIFRVLKMLSGVVCLFCWGDAVIEYHAHILRLKLLDISVGIKRRESCSFKKKKREEKAQLHFSCSASCRGWLHHFNLHEPSLSLLLQIQRVYYTLYCLFYTIFERKTFFISYHTKWNYKEVDGDSSTFYSLLQEWSTGHQVPDDYRYFFHGKKFQWKKTRGIKKTEREARQIIHSEPG